MANKIQWLLIKVLLLNTASFTTYASVDLSKIHEHMTDDELFSTFNVKDRTAVPDYQVVPVFHDVHRNRRSISSYNQKERYTVTFKNMQLYLEPVNHVLLGENTPVYIASGNKSHTLGIRYKRIQKAWPSNFTMYQDFAKNAAVALFKEPDGKVNIEGTIGNDLVIKPMPSRFYNGMYLLKNDEYTSHHIVYKKNLWSIGNIFDDTDWQKYFSYIPPKKYQSSRVKSKVNTVYPEVLVIVDHETYLAHGKNVPTLCKYIAVFWNAVDLRFRAMKKPKIRLNIAGLIVPIDKYGAPYMTHHREGKNYLRISETFDDIGKYLYQDKRFGRNMYDFAVAITNLNLCSTKQNGCNPSTLGMARVGGACNHNEDSSVAAVAVAEDRGSFDGVLTVAHEIGHLLGAVHDGEDSYFGPGAMNCKRSDGFLMASSGQGSSNAFLWSDCSIQQMSYFLRSEAECLRNKPIVKKAYPKFLPGQLISRNEQCRIMLGMIECKGEGTDGCGELYCRKPGGMFNYNCVSFRPPAEGSPCNDGGVCFDGFCVHEEKEENNEVTERTTTAALKGTELILGTDD